MKKKLLTVGWVLLFSLLTVGIVLGFTASNIDGVWGEVDTYPPGNPGIVVDVIGVIGDTSAPGVTTDQTKTRKTTVCGGDVDGDNTFAEWNNATGASFAGLGTYSGCTTATSLFFSEYVFNERTSTTDSGALEIYNGTGAAVNLDGWAVRLYTSPTVYTLIELNPAVSLANGDVYVLIAAADEGDTTQEDQVYPNLENYSTVVLVQDYRAQNEVGATCDNYATGGDQSLAGAPTEIQSIWWDQTSPGIRNKDWNQVRYGIVGGTCASTAAYFVTQSGMGFDGVDFPAPVVYQQPFVIGTFCHYNNPITAPANPFGSAELFITIQNIVCEAPTIPEPAIPSQMTFVYNFRLDETPNTAPCTYTTGAAIPCADAIFISQDPNPATFTCRAPGTPPVLVEYTVSILGFNPQVGGVCPATFDPAQSLGAFISDEGSSNCTCLYGMVTDFSPTAVDLLSFTGTRMADGILLEWQTANEIDNLGFNLYRAASESGTKVKLNADLIPTKVMPGSLVGASYSFEDFTATASEAYFYWLEDVEASGTTTMHGPVEVP